MTVSRFVLMVALSLTAMSFTMCCKQTRMTSEAQSGVSGGTEVVPVTTGVVGRVEIWEGNFMPPVPPDRRNSQIKPGAGRRVRVHEPVRIEGGLISITRSEIPTPLIAEAVADSAGNFAIAVPPGTYSIFVEEDGKWYASGISTNGIQGEVGVEEGTTTEAVIKVTTKATF